MLVPCRGENFTHNEQEQLLLIKPCCRGVNLSRVCCFPGIEPHPLEGTNQSSPSMAPNGFRRDFVSRKLDCDSQSWEPDRLFQTAVTTTNIQGPAGSCAWFWDSCSCQWADIVLEQWCILICTFSQMFLNDWCNFCSYLFISSESGDVCQSRTRPLYWTAYFLSSFLNAPS